MADDEVLDAKPPPVKKQRKSMSAVWKEVEPITTTDGVRCKCLHCNEVLAVDYGKHVERLRRHFRVDEYLRWTAGKGGCSNNPFASNDYHFTSKSPHALTSAMSKIDTLAAVTKSPVLEVASPVPIAIKPLSSSSSGSSQGLPSLTKAELTRFKTELAGFFYETGTSFAHVDNNRLVNALKALRPDVVLPTKEELAGELLDAQFDSMKREVKKNLGQSRVQMCVAIDD